MVTKKELAEKAFEIAKNMANGKSADKQKNGKKTITDTQIRNFVEAAKNGDNFQEFLIYLRYQAVKNKFDISEIENYLVKNFESDDFSKSKELIAYFLGNIARCLKIERKDKNGSDKE